MKTIKLYASTLVLGVAVLSPCLQASPPLHTSSTHKHTHTSDTHQQLQDDFVKAADDIRTLTDRPSDQNLLKLYGLFKQATCGDNTAKKPSFFDVKARKKHEAWLAHKGQPRDEAKRAYIKLVGELMG